MNHPGRELDLNPVIQIDGHTFNVSLLTPTRAWELGAKLINLVGEPIAALAGSENPDKMKEALPLAVKALGKNLSNPEALSIVQALFRQVSQQGRMINFDTYFLGQMGLMFKVLVKLIEIQFSDYFQGVVESVQQITALGKPQA